MSRNWIVVAPADHVGRGRAGGFMQSGHGKLAPLRRLRPGDRVVAYSPTTEFGVADKRQAFTALGIVRNREPYQADMGGGFRPYRCDVDWLAAEEATIRPLLDQLEFTAGGPNWGYRLRRGLFEISGHDVALIAAAMAAVLP